MHVVISDVQHAAFYDLCQQVSPEVHEFLSFAFKKSFPALCTFWKTQLVSMYHQLYFLPPLSCFHAHLLALSHIHVTTRTSSQKTRTKNRNTKYIYTEKRKKWNKKSEVFKKSALFLIHKDKYLNNILSDWAVNCHSLASTKSRRRRRRKQNKKQAKQTKQTKIGKYIL